MRTTLRLPDELYDEVRRHAAETGQTLTAVLEDAIRESMNRRKRRVAPPRPPLPTYNSGGLQPGVDLDDSASLLELMEGRSG